MSDCGRSNCQVLGEHYHDEIELREHIATLEAEMTQLREAATRRTPRPQCRVCGGWLDTKKSDHTEWCWIAPFFAHTKEKP